jgi:hypothetical protein
MELVAHGEHLKQAADELERAQWDTQRELRALALTSTFRSLVGAAGGPVEDAVSKFAYLAQEAVSKGVPLHHTEEFAGYLREVGEILTASSDGEPDVLAERLTQTTVRLEAVPVTTQPPVVKAEVDHPTRPRAHSAEVEAQIDEEPETEVAAAPVGDLPSLEQEPEVVDVTVESLPPVVEQTAVAEEPWATNQRTEVAETEPAPEPTEQPVAAPAVENETAGPGLAASWGRYEQLDQEAEQSEPSIEELLGQARPVGQPVPVTDAESPVVVEERTEDVVPITQLGFDEAAPHEPVEYGSNELRTAAAVPISELCYSGSAALERAHSVRDQIRAALAEPQLQGPHIQDLVDELLDLVDLSIEQ